MRSSVQAAVQERWGYPFWDVVRDMAEQGLTRNDVSRAVGYASVQQFSRVLSKNKDKNPFGCASKPLDYFLDTGERFGDAVRRMASEGMTVYQVSQAIGYKGIHAFRYAMRARGIEVEFASRGRPLNVERLKLMAAAGMIVSECATAMGYRSINALRAAMARTGVSVEFAKLTSSRVKIDMGIHPWEADRKNFFAKQAVNSIDKPSTKSA